MLCPGTHLRRWSTSGLTRLAADDGHGRDLFLPFRDLVLIDVIHGFKLDSA